MGSQLPKRPRGGSTPQVQLDPKRACITSLQQLSETSVPQISLHTKKDRIVSGISEGEPLKSTFLKHIWPKLEDDYRLMVQEVIKYCDDQLSSQVIPAKVDGRVKSIDSIEKSLCRRGKHRSQHTNEHEYGSVEEIFHDIHDLAGIRIVVDYPSDIDRANQLIKHAFQAQKEPNVFSRDRQVGKSWEVWFGAYQSYNHRVMFKPETTHLRAYHHVMFEVQLTSLPESLYNRLAHPLLYKQPGGISRQDEMVIDLSHGLALCWSICQLIMQDKLDDSPGKQNQRELREAMRNAVPAPGAEPEKGDMDALLGMMPNTDLGVRHGKGSRPTDGANVAQPVSRELFLEKLSTLPEECDPTENLWASFTKKMNNWESKINAVGLAVKDTSQTLRQIERGEKDQKCLRDLRVINPKTQKTTIQKTKGGLLKDAYRWILDHADFCRFREDPESRLLWIKGDPGKGKTMLLCGIIDELQKESSQTISYFFCQATQDHQLRNATAVLRSLIWLLCSSQPHLTSHVRKRYDEEGKDLFVDVSAFSALEEILQEILEDPSLEDAVFIIDAMDECSEKTRTELIDLVVRFSESCHAKWIVSSRNWPAIEEQFEVADKVKVSLELNKDAVSKAVDIFIDSKVDHLARVKRYDAKTKEAVYDTLRQKANDTFLWVALVCTELARPNIRSWNTMDTLHSIPKGLEKLYERMFEYTLNCVNATYCRQILATTCVAFRPIAFDELRVLVKALEDFSPEQLEQMIGECGSFLTLEEGIVYFVHQSAQDFLLKQADDTFPTSIKGQHCLIFRRSLEVLTELKRNPYRLQSPGVLINEISRPDPDPLAHFQYSCVHWVDHLEQADDERNTSDVEKIVQFVEARLLYWLEALSLLGKMSEGAHAVQKLKSMMQNVNHEALQSLIKDVRRFVLAYRHVLEIAPLQVYASALVFCPTGSLVKKLFQREEVNWIDNISNIPEHWDACIQTLEGRLALAVAFSPDDRRLALCLVDNSIRIWDTVSSNYVQVIEPVASPRDVPQSVAYSPGEQCLAIGLGDGTIEIWDLDSARRIQQMQVHQDAAVQDLAFSPDGTLLASCARGGVKLMHLAITDSIPTMRASDDDDDNPWVHLSAMMSLSNIESISFVAGDLLATGLEGGTVQVWDIQSGTCVKMIQSRRPGSKSLAMAFSGLNRHVIASRSPCGMVVWRNKRLHAEPFTGFNKVALSAALSSDGQLLASSVNDRTVKIWDLTLDSDADLDNDYRFGLRNLMIFSPDGRWIASYQYSGPVEIWDSLKRTCITTLDVSRINERSPVFSADGQWFLSMSSQHTKLWKTADWTCVKTWGPTRFCVFSPDSRLLGLVLFGSCIVWDVTVESTLQKLDVCASSMALSACGTRLVLTSRGVVSIYSTSTGEEIRMSPHVDGHGGNTSDDNTSDGEEDKTLWMSTEITDVRDNEHSDNGDPHSSVQSSNDSKCPQSRSANTREDTDLCSNPEVGHDYDSDLSEDSSLAPSWFRGPIVLSKDSQWLAVGTLDKTQVWSTESGTLIYEFDDGRRCGRNTLIEVNSKWLVCTTEQSSIKVRDMRTGTLIAVVYGTVTLGAMWFDPANDSRLHTCMGTIDIDTQTIRRVGYGISEDGEWILKGSMKFLWIPSEYRSARTAIRGATLVIQCDSGRIVTVRLKEIEQGAT